MPPAEPRNPTGPTGVIAAQRVKELREARGWTYAELSKRLSAAGRSIPPLGLRRIESQNRRIDLDDAAALAVVLGVNPSALMAPLRTHGRIDVTGAGDQLQARDVWQWLDGKRALNQDPEGNARVYFQEHGRPIGRRYYTWETPAEREALGAIYEDVEGATVVRDDDGKVIEIHMPDGTKLPRPIDLDPDEDEADAG